MSFDNATISINKIENVPDNQAPLPIRLEDIIKHNQIPKNRRKLDVLFFIFYVPNEAVEKLQKNGCHTAY